MVQPESPRGSLGTSQASRIRAYTQVFPSPPYDRGMTQSPAQPPPPLVGPILPLLGRVLETLLDQVRGGKRAISAELSDALLASVDVLRDLLVAAETGDPDDTAAPTVYMDNPKDLRVLAAALLMAADWMEGGK